MCVSPYPARISSHSLSVTHCLSNRFNRPGFMKRSLRRSTAFCSHHQLRRSHLCTVSMETYSKLVRNIATQLTEDAFTHGNVSQAVPSGKTVELAQPREVCIPPRDTLPLGRLPPRSTSPSVDLWVEGIGGKIIRRYVVFWLLTSVNV